MTLLSKNPFISTGSGGTPVDVPNASTSQAGKVQLSNAIDSDSQLQASTPLAVKTALSESKTYTDDAIANLNIQDIIDDLNDHELALINTEQGLHGIRIWQDKIQQTNDNGATWIDVAVGSGNGTVASVNGELPDVNGNVEIVIEDGTLTDKGIVQLTNDIIEDETLSATPKAVFDALTEAKDYADTLIDDLESTLIKHPFELRPTTQGQLEFDMPAIYNLNPDWYITSLHFNSIKLLESQYSIVEKVTGDSTQGYKLVLTSPAPDYTSAIYELELIGGKALANGTGSTGSVNSVNNILPDTAGNVEIPQATTTIQGITQLADIVDDTDDKAVTPKAVKDYIDDFESTLTIDQRRIPIAQGQSIIPIDNLNYTPQDFVLMLFNNTTMEFENGYTIQSSTTSNSGYEILLTEPIPYPEGAEFELILIYGKAVANGEGATGTVISVNGILADTTGNVEIPNATDSAKGLTQLHTVVDETEDKAITPKAVKQYIEELEGDLTKQAFMLIPDSVGQTEIDMPTVYNPNKHIDIIFSNSIKLVEDRYSIEEKVLGDPTQGYKLVLVDPVVDPATTLYNLLLISGTAIGSTGGGEGTVVSVNGLTPNAMGDIELPSATVVVEGLTLLSDTVNTDTDKSVTPNAVKEYVDENNRMWVDPVSAPPNTSYFWIKE